MGELLEEFSEIAGRVPESIPKYVYGLNISRRIPYVFPQGIYKECVE